MKRSGMSIDIYFNEWLMICGLELFGDFLCVVEVERVQLIGCEIAAFL